jgi:hypothetical protein
MITIIIRAIQGAKKERLFMTLNILNMEIHDLFDQFTEHIDGHVEQNKWEQLLIIPSHIGKGSVTRTRIRPGMEIMYTDITYEQDMKLHIQEACPLIELSYNVSGEIYCEWNGKESRGLFH